MTHDIEAVTHWIAGDSKTLEFTVTDDDVDLDTATIEWYLFESEDDFDNTNAVLSDDDSDVTVDVISGEDDRFDVDVDQDVTDGFNGTYWQQVIVDPQGNSKQTWRGLVEIER